MSTTRGFDMQCRHPCDLAEAVGVHPRLIYDAINAGHIDARVSASGRPWIWPSEFERIVDAYAQGNLTAALKGLL
jgi:hypothetical protein